MYAQNWDSVTTSGPVRRVELPFRTHEIYPSSPTTAVKRRYSHSRGKTTKYEGRPKSRTPGAEMIQTEALETENLVDYTRVRQLPDGTWVYYRYSYPAPDSAPPPKQRVAKNDISDPTTYLPMPDVDGVNDWQSSDVVPAVNEPVVSSDDYGVEYDTRLEYPDKSGLGQPSATIDSDAVDWDGPQLETSGYHSQHSADYDQPYYTKPKHRRTTSKQKRRDSFSAPSQKPPFIQRFVYGGLSREVMKLDKVKNDRVDLWLRDLGREIAQNLVQQSQYYPNYGEYQTTQGHR